MSFLDRITRRATLPILGYKERFDQAESSLNDIEITDPDDLDDHSFESLQQYYQHLPTTAVAMRVTVSNLQIIADWINEHADVRGALPAEVISLGTMANRRQVISIQTGECRLFAVVGDFVAQLRPSGAFTKMNEEEFLANYLLAGE